jgi:hypothetical protein
MNSGTAKQNLFSMCGDNEDWIHIITCKSLDAELIRADSWIKLRKVMEKWGMSKDMLLTI